MLAPSCLALLTACSRPLSILKLGIASQTTHRHGHGRCCLNMSASEQQKHVVVDPFCFRQFAEHAVPGYTGTVFDVSIAAFEDVVNERFNEKHLKDGYAPFCKHLFLANSDIADVAVNVLPITPDNEHLLRTKYEARNEKELPVLIRYFPKELLGNNIQLPKAKYLDLILYSREQIRKENEAQGTVVDNDDDIVTAPWGIVSIKAQDLDCELPMNPITNMRNALGKEHGGSGVPIDRASYLEAVDYWKDHAVVV